jgi:hypothetical protein
MTLQYKPKGEVIRNLLSTRFPEVEVENVVDKAKALLWSDDKAGFIKADWRDKFVTKTQADLEKLCRADGVGGLRWFPTSEYDGEWLVVDSLADRLIGGEWIGGDRYTKHDTHFIECHNGARIQVVAGAKAACIPKDDIGPYTHLQVSILATKAKIDFWSGVVTMTCGGQYTPEVYWEGKRWRVFENVPSYQIQDFIATNSGESTGPPVVNGFFAPFAVDVDEGEFERIKPGKFDIELDNTKITADLDLITRPCKEGERNE